jgi:hypothetical protein
VFFRAKDFTSVEKVLGGMIGLNGVILSEKLAIKLSFLQSHGIRFNSDWLSHAGLSHTKDFLIVIGMVVFVVVMKNSQEWEEKLKPNLFMQIAIAFILSLGILSLSKVSEFLYFQF